MGNPPKNFRYAGCLRKVISFRQSVIFSFCFVMCFAIACTPFPEIYFFNETDYDIQVSTKYKRVKIQPRSVKQFTWRPGDPYLKIQKDSGKVELYQIPPTFPPGYGRFKVNVNAVIFGFVFKNDKIYILKNEHVEFSEENQPDKFPLVPLKKEVEG